MFCPKCKAEYREGVRACADCGVALVRRLPDPCDGGDAELEFEEVLATYNPGDIAIVKSVLDAAGVPYFFQGENFLYARPLLEPARLLVPAERAAETRDLLGDLKLAYRGISGFGGG